ncbi:protein SdhA [uncultured Legionella sp.]|uniref:protein SdhA n=1 Tax=uncultured Legionella sp. TaxID=210934 RepID=UPI0026081003|nr:protein SdhA [uncultured Legionella sp.]
MIIQEKIKAIIKLSESLREHQFSKLITTINSLILDTLLNQQSNYFNPRIAPYLNKINKTGVPYTNYDLDPDNISQIKKMINALYHARLALEDLESINLKQDGLTVENIARIYSNTIHHGYQASYLLTHLDVDIKDMFNDELQMILPVVGKLMKFINSHSEDTKKFTKTLQEYPISYKVGEVMGTAVNQMQPSSGDLDYKFLTQFSAVLPSYISQFTQYVKKYSYVIAEREPTLNSQQLEELRKAALTLLNDLENLKGNSLFLSFKVLNYIHIMRNIITLSMSSLEQMGHFSESSQDVIRDNLAQLKYVLLPTLFGLVDKIEDNAMLKPGTLSIPLMEQITPLYGLLIKYASKPVNFKEKGEELLSIEDSRFLALRLERTYGRINAANKAIFKIEKAEQALISFYEILENPLYQELATHQLPPEVKSQLITHYKLISPYMMHVDFDLNDRLIDSLQGPETFSSWFGKPFRWLNDELPADHLSFVLERKNELQTFISKKRATEEFHINLNMDLINSVNKKTDLVLFPYSEQTNVFAIDESETLNPAHSCALFSLSNTYTLKPTPKINYTARTLYLEALTEGLRYEIIGLKGTVETALISWDKLKDIPRDVAAIKSSESKYLPQLLELIAVAGHASATAKLTIKAAIPHEPQTLYLETTNNGLKYELINLQGILETSVIPWEKLPDHPHDVSTLIASKEKYLAKLLEFTSEAGQTLSSDALKIDELTPLLRERSAVILLNNKNLVYVDAIKKKITPLQSTPDNQEHMAQLKEKITSSYQVAKDAELKLIKQLTGRSHLGFKPFKGQIVLSNPSDLTADQALDLEQWYKNKRDKFMVARNAYDEFIALLKKQVTPPGKTDGTVLHLSRLDTVVKARCRNLYNLFQPYFINGIPVELKSSALEFDKYLVHAFTDNAHHSAPAVDMFEQLDEHFQVYFTEIDLSWSRKSRVYSKYAQDKFTEENDAALLEHDATIGNRGHYVIQHTNYSKYINEFRTDLKKHLLVFNQAMQAELKQQSSGIPYPELEDPHTLLAQNKQVIALKRIFNSVFHLERVMIDLEKLNNRSTESRYVYHLARAYEHVNEIMVLTKDLATDPHFSLIAREILEKVQTMHATIEEHIDPYQVAPDEVNYKHQMQFNGLWYTLNAFYISPKHIRSLRNNNYLTAEELNDLHISAKRSAAQIESIINSAGSYFKLFLQIPNMISLYSNMTSKLNEFISTTHDGVINNLDQFNAKIFTPMLLEADHWEDKLGLIPGHISGPLKKIIDEYYKGLLYPLELPAKTHVDLICDKTPIEKRVQTTTKKIENAEKHLEKLEKNYKHVNKLFYLINAYENFAGGLVQLEKTELREITKDKMMTSYVKALPKLVLLQLKLTVESDDNEKNKLLDDLLNSSLKEYQPKLNQIKDLVAAAHHYYLGVKATYQMQLATTREKLAYLQDLTQSQQKANRLFVENYTEESFKKQTEAFCNRHIGLQYTDKEYRNKLREYLMTYREQIVFKAKTTDDINLTVRNLLKEKIKLFEENNFVKYFHLDTVRVALAQFKNYFSISTLAIEQNDSLFENEKTLGDKTEKINNLLEFAENEALTVEERFSQIKLDVEDPSFGRIILAHKPADHFSFTYLIHCVLYLLETIYLYTPTRKHLYNNLEEAVNTKPQINELTKRFGLFAKPQVPQIQPVIELEELEAEHNNGVASTIAARV